MSERAKPVPWRSNGGLIENPKLVFRNARVEEASDLKSLYEEAWGCGIKIDESQIISKIRSFPEGQIVGCESWDAKPVSMINIMLSKFDARGGFMAGYEKVTGERTFSTHVSLGELLDIAGPTEIPVALCVSIAVRRSSGRNGYALETLNHAIAFAEENGVIAVPYSAPRGFAAAREKNPAIDVENYLHMTIPSDIGYEAHIARVRRLNASGRISRGFRKSVGTCSIMEVSQTVFCEYQAMGPDSPLMGRSSMAYFRFFGRDGAQFFSTYGRYPLIEDFCLLTGRKLLDPVMRMHVDNGARFIRDHLANLSAVFSGSRPEDSAAAGYNVLLTYGYHPLLGQDYVDVSGLS